MNKDIRGLLRDSSEVDAERALKMLGYVKEDGRLETEESLKDVLEQVTKRDTALARLRIVDRITWFLMSLVSVELIFIFLHSAGMIVIPGAILVGIGTSLGGSTLGLGGGLFRIAKELGLFTAKGNS
ncbi:MAG TPA: hypothetical protein VE842_06545 [Pyrinomonadaceae bacterium]|nr:hypothetical protein [Pyrinomonadaceae bacterium]